MWRASFSGRLAFRSKYIIYKFYSINLDLHVMTLVLKPGVYIVKIYRSIS